MLCQAGDVRLHLRRAGALVPPGEPLDGTSPGSGPRQSAAGGAGSSPQTTVIVVCHRVLELPGSGGKSREEPSKAGIAQFLAGKRQNDRDGDLSDGFRAATRIRPGQPSRRLFTAQRQNGFEEPSRISQSRCETAFCEQPRISIVPRGVVKIAAKAKDNLDAAAKLTDRTGNRSDYRALTMPARANQTWMHRTN